MLVQHESTIQQCPRIILEYSDDGIDWIERYRYGFGSYSLSSEEELEADIDQRMTDEDLRPPMRLARYWRIVCNQELLWQWGIIELDFYDDVECTRSLRRSKQSILHSRGSAWPPDNAFDWREDTLWKTGCGKCYPGTKCEPCEKAKAYLGLEFKKLVVVRCVKLIQLDEGDGNCPEVRLQFSSTGLGNDWFIRDTFENVPQFAFLRPYQTATDVGGALRHHGPLAISLCQLLFFCTYVFL